MCLKFFICCEILEQELLFEFPFEVLYVTRIITSSAEQQEYITVVSRWKFVDAREAKQLLS